MSPEPTVLLTGAQGFIGGHLHAALLRTESYRVRAGVRRPVHDDEMPVSESLTAEHWREQLTGVDVIVHAAARAHVLHDAQADSPCGYQQVNVDMTRQLALGAAMAGVKRLIFISTIGVNGASSTTAFTESDPAAPHNAYAQSKYRAEQALWEVADNTALEVVILRLPLVYGPGVPANFKSMMQWVDAQIPLPLGAVNNQRSLLGIDNLADAVVLTLEHPAAANQLFLLADGSDVSTPALLTEVARHLGCKSRLFACPTGLLVWGAKVLGKGAMANKLCASLQVDASKAKRVLNWAPATSLSDGLQRTVQMFRREQN
jgi:nucleoside-diphosphate-sugar epimerase